MSDWRGLRPSSKYSPNWYWKELGYTVVRTPRPNGIGFNRKILDTEGNEVDVFDGGDINEDRHKAETRTAARLYRELNN